MADSAETFDPATLPVRPMQGGSQYMDVKFRLVWLREAHPDATIDVDELLHVPNEIATFKAVVAIPGAGRATGHGSETRQDFRDYYEKAETKAIGRALAGLGFGTQFLPADGEALADSPVDRPAGRGEAPTPLGARRPANAGTTASLAQPLTDKQLKFLWALAREQGTSADDVHAETFRRWEKASVGDLTRGEASEIIDWLNGATPPAPPAQPTGHAGSGDVDWTAAWIRLRELGCSNAMQFTELTGKAIDQKDPDGTVTLYERAKAERDRALDVGPAGDRWTR